MKLFLILLLLLIHPDLLDHLESSNYLQPCSIESINLIKATEDKQQAETERLQTQSEYERAFAEWIIATNEESRTHAEWIRIRNEFEKSTNPKQMKVFTEWRQALTEQDRVDLVYEEASFNKEEALSKYDKAKLEREQAHKVLMDCLNSNENKS